MFAWFHLGFGLRARPRCLQTTADSLGRSVRCQLLAHHAEAHRYMDGLDAVTWGSPHLIAASSLARAVPTPADPPPPPPPLTHRSGLLRTLRPGAIPAPGRVVWPLIVSHFARRSDR